jgi:hypothetical protein
LEHFAALPCGSVDAESGVVLLVVLLLRAIFPEIGGEEKRDD